MMTVSGEAGGNDWAGATHAAASSNTTAKNRGAPFGFTYRN
jgi:hypothetical protein